MSSDGEVLARVLERKDFLQSVFHNDDADDWSLVKSLGKLLVRIESDSEIMGHALQARACRHLGELDHARKELEQCQIQIAQRGFKPWEAELIRPLLIEEEKRSGVGGQADGSGGGSPMPS